MFDCKLNKRNAVITTIAAVSILSLASCAKKGTSEIAHVTPQGTVNVDELKVGLPEKTFKNATITFVLDNNPAATGGGKTQYWSRVPNKKGGKVVATCKDDKCFVLRVNFESSPVSKDDALETLKQLLPADAPPQTKEETKKPNDIYDFGDQYTGMLQQSPTDDTKYILVSAIAMSPDEVRAAMAGQAPKAKSKSKEAAASTSSDSTAPADAH